MKLRSEVSPEGEKLLQEILADPKRLRTEEQAKAEFRKVFSADRSEGKTQKRLLNKERSRREKENHRSTVSLLKARGRKTSELCFAISEKLGWSTVQDERKFVRTYLNFLDRFIRQGGAKKTKSGVLEITEKGRKTNQLSDLRRKNLGVRPKRESEILYALQHLGGSATTKDLASKIGMATNRIRRSLQFYLKKGVVTNTWARDEHRRFVRIWSIPVDS